MREKIEVQDRVLLIIITIHSNTATNNPRNALLRIPSRKEIQKLRQKRRVILKTRASRPRRTVSPVEDGLNANALLAELERVKGDLEKRLKMVPGAMDLAI